MANGWWCKTCKAFVEHAARTEGYQIKDICPACGGLVHWLNEEPKEVAELKAAYGGARPIKTEFMGGNYWGPSSLRDWFAGQAREKDISTYAEQHDSRVTARYRYADAMLDARKPPKSATGPSEGLPEPSEEHTEAAKDKK